MWRIAIQVVVSLRHKWLNLATLQLAMKFMALEDLHEILDNRFQS